MKHLALVPAFLVSSYACAQSPPQPKPVPASGTEPTKAETLEYIRGKLFALSAADPKVVNIRVDEDACTLTDVFNGYEMTVFFKNLDSNNFFWKLDDEPDKNHPRLSLQLISRDNLEAGHFTFPHPSNANRPHTTMYLNFDLNTVSEIPDFRRKMETAFRRVITLCSGVSTKEPF